jgi:hypothetical protein
MTDQTWNDQDYLFDFPDVPAYEGPLSQAPFMHKVNWVWRYIFDDLLEEAHRAVNAGSELAGLIIALAIVDYLAGYRIGRQSTGDDYIAFIRDYFPHQYDPFARHIYIQIRNGLMHNLVALNPWRSSGPIFLIHPNHTAHLHHIEDDRTAFSILTFLEDIRRAWVKFAHELVVDANPELVSNFIRRFDRLDGRGAFMHRIPD